MLDQEYSCLQRETQERIRNAFRVNFKGQRYIRSGCLREIFSTGLLWRLFPHDDKQLGRQLSFHKFQHEDEMNRVKSTALRLLGMCVFVNVSLETFVALFNSGACDNDLPLDNESTRLFVGAAEQQSVLQHQDSFISYPICDDGAHHFVPTSMPLPIVFDELDDRVGHGSFSEVYKVKVDLDAQPLCERPIFALKRFKPSKDAQSMFWRERAVLEDLRKRPHDHIAAHLSSLTDEDTFYILFPLARCSLRHFMNRTNSPPLHRDFVLWFFSQTNGLAEAVLHLHASGIRPAKEQWTPEREFVPSTLAMHGDIKPENILVFEAASQSSLGTLKISDFGMTQISENLLTTISPNCMRLRGTEAYEGPDLLHTNELSCALDMWSLGCVFLELLLWTFKYPTSEDPGFMTERSNDTLSHSPSFWTLSWSGCVSLKASVRKRLDDLKSFHCIRRTAFFHFLWLIRYLLFLDPKHRFSALRTSNDTEACLRQAELDLAENANFFLDAPLISTIYAKPIPSWEIGYWWYNDGPQYAKAAIANWNKGLKLGFNSAKHQPPPSTPLVNSKLSNLDRKLMSKKWPYVAHEGHLWRTFPSVEAAKSRRPLWPWLNGSEEKDVVTHDTGSAGSSFLVR